MDQTDRQQDRVTMLRVDDGCAEVDTCPGFGTHVDDPEGLYGIIPAFTPVRFTAHHGFHIYDADAVHVGTTSATALLSDREDVQTYAELFGRLFSVAVFGDAARAIMARLIDEYRRRL